jgi:hypothetical protein
MSVCAALLQASSDNAPLQYISRPIAQGHMTDISPSHKHSLEQEDEDDGVGGQSPTPKRRRVQ